jgi:4,5-DOPA dioxygenase extradiol
VPEWAAEFQARVNAALIAGDPAALLDFAPDDRAAELAVNSGEHYAPLLYAAGARRPGDEAVIFSDNIDGALSMTSVAFGDPARIEGLRAALGESAIARYAAAQEVTS